MNNKIRRPNYSVIFLTLGFILWMIATVIGNNQMALLVNQQLYSQVATPKEKEKSPHRGSGRRELYQAIAIEHL